jgi:uncharacterized membrane protein YqjE
MLKYVLLVLAAVYVVWTIYKAVMHWTDRRMKHGNHLR